ncbi:hypothetical protein HDV00_008774 [Rhizophlyctis rosea]|nr:hypothetical protein HDV00_008774 [Rhizophlyctis rosea]
MRVDLNADVPDGHVTEIRAEETIRRSSDGVVKDITVCLPPNSFLHTVRPEGHILKENKTPALIDIIFEETKQTARTIDNITASNGHTRPTVIVHTLPEPNIYGHRRVVEDWDTGAHLANVVHRGRLEICGSQICTIPIDENDHELKIINLRKLEDSKPVKFRLSDHRHHFDFNETVVAYIHCVDRAPNRTGPDLYDLVLVRLADGKQLGTHRFPPQERHNIVLYLKITRFNVFADGLVFDMHLNPLYEFYPPGVHDGGLVLLGDSMLVYNDTDRYMGGEQDDDSEEEAGNTGKMVVVDTITRRAQRFEVQDCYNGWDDKGYSCAMVEYPVDEEGKRTRQNGTINVDWKWSE